MKFFSTFMLFVKKRMKERCHGKPVVVRCNPRPKKTGAFVVALRRSLKIEFVFIEHLRLLSLH